MRKTRLAVLGAACVFAVLPSLGAAAIQAPTFLQGNDYGQRDAVVNYPLPTNADEGALVGPTFCLPAAGRRSLSGPLRSTARASWTAVRFACR